MFGMKAVPFIGELAMKADAAVPYVAMALKTVSLIAPEYGAATIQLADSLRTKLAHRAICSKHSE